MGKIPEAMFRPRVHHGTDLKQRPVDVRLRHEAKEVIKTEEIETYINLMIDELFNSRAEANSQIQIDIFKKVKQTCKFTIVREGEDAIRIQFDQAHHLALLVGYLFGQDFNSGKSSFIAEIKNKYPNFNIIVEASPITKSV